MLRMIGWSNHDGPLGENNPILSLDRVSGLEKYYADYFCPKRQPFRE